MKILVISRGKTVKEYGGYIIPEDVYQDCMRGDAVAFRFYGTRYWMTKPGQGGLLWSPLDKSRDAEVCQRSQ